MKNLMTMISCLALSALVLNPVGTLSAQEKTSTPKGPTKRPVVDMMKLGEYFTNFNLPKDMQGGGLRFSTRRLKFDPAEYPWMEESARTTMSTCQNPYAIDVQRDAAKQIYFYCLDNSSIAFLGRYDLVEGTWTQKN